MQSFISISLPIYCLSRKETLLHRRSEREAISKTDFEIMAPKICDVLEKLHENHILRYPFVVYFMQTSMCCYYISQTLITIAKIVFLLFFFHKFLKIHKKPSHRRSNHPSAASKLTSHNSRWSCGAYRGGYHSPLLADCYYHC